MKSYTTRRNVRATLSTQVIIRGTDRAGKNFQIEGESIDFSRRGLGLLVPRDVVAPGAVVSVTMPNKFRTSGVVRWTRQDESTGQIRLGVQMLETRANLAVRLGASLLLCLALIGEISFARSRGAALREANGHCSMSSLTQMKSSLQGKIGSWVNVTDSEKAFVHKQHQQITCSEYTKAYEKSGSYSDKNKRAAVSRWHWNQYHSKDDAIRTAAIESAQSTSAGGN
jgi:hypothetical protein